MNMAVVKKLIRAEIGLTATEQLILDALKREGEMHGTQVARAAGIPVGSVYTLLQRLEKKGQVIRIEEYVPFGSTSLKRVIYRPSQ